MPAGTVVNQDGQMIIAEELPEDQAMSSNALSRLAAAVASARGQEIHIISGPQGMGRRVAGQERQQIITTQVSKLCAKLCIVETWQKNVCCFQIRL